MGATRNPQGKTWEADMLDWEEPEIDLLKEESTAEISLILPAAFCCSTLFDL